MIKDKGINFIAF